MKLSLLYISLSPLTPLINISPRSSRANPHSDRTFRVASGTWIRPLTPVVSIRLARFTVAPQMSYWGLVAPITPATTGPWAIPYNNDMLYLDIWWQVDDSPHREVGHSPTRSLKFWAESRLVSFKVSCIANANRTSSLRWFHSSMDAWKT